MTAQTEPPRLGYRISEVAEALNVSPDSIRRAVRKGEIPAKLLFGCKIIPADVYNRLLDDAPSAAS